MLIVKGTTGHQRFCWPQVSFSHGSGSAARPGQQDTVAVRHFGDAAGVTGQGHAAAIRPVAHRATGFGSGCRSTAAPERLQPALSQHTSLQNRPELSAVGLA